MKKLTKIIMLVTLTMLLVSACAPGTADMPNPASQFCQENGGKVEIRNSGNGQLGVCVFPDGSECDEWEYARGECEPASDVEEEEPVGMPNPASVFCEEQGGKLELREEENGVAGYCLFVDGSECEEWAFFRGECNASGGKFLPPSDPQGDFYTGEVYINNAEVILSESDPEKVSVTVEGEMPTPCDQLQAIVNPPDVENKIVIELLSWQENGELSCVQMISPFLSTIDIPADDLPDGTYSIWVEGETIGEFEVPVK